MKPKAKNIVIKTEYVFLFIFSLFLFNSTTKIGAMEYCSLFINNTLIETIELPFYLYENKINYVIEGASMPAIETSSTPYLIDSSTRCDKIEKVINNDLNNPISNKTYYEYTKELYKKLPSYSDIPSSNLNINGTLKGYSSFIDKEPPYFEGYKESYTTNINNPLSFKFILNQISAYDSRDGNLTDKIIVEFNSYEENINKIGTYSIILSVCDSSNNKTSLTFYIQIIDTTPPLINGLNEYDSFLSNPLTIEHIQSNLQVTDNVNNNLESELYVCNDTYSPNKKNLGTYTIHFCVYDLSNNLSEPFKVTINVKDDIKPIIEGLNYFTSYLSNPLQINEIMYSLAAHDNEKDISSSIFIQKDYYSSQLNTIGEKSIYFQAMDDYGNVSAPFKVTINLIDDIPPQIFGLDTYTSYLSNPLSLTYLKQQLTALDNYDGNITHLLEIKEDSYTMNINKKGTFYLSFQVQDTSKNTSNLFKMKITSIDDISPYISGPSSLSYLIKDKPSISNILREYKAKDNVDENLEIIIEEDTFSSSLNLGTYYISLSCIDSSNNKSAPFKIKINLVDKLLNLNELTLYLQTTSLTSINEITKLIGLSEEYTILEDTYTPNYSLKGTYNINYELNDSSIIKVTIITYEPLTTNEVKKESKKETFFSKIKSFFQNIINSIKKFFKTIFFINIY